jgi:hypothetical protein
MATAKFLLVLLCSALTSSAGMLKLDLLMRLGRHLSTQQQLRAALVKTAEGELGTREIGGNNQGPRIAEYLAVVKLKRPEPWCAAFISWVFRKNGYAKPCSGWSPDLFPRSRLARSALPGNLIGIYFPDLKRIAHVGMIISQKNDLITTVEGNTNVAGSREGDGVMRRIRHRRTVYQISDWITERGAKP